MDANSTCERCGVIVTSHPRERYCDSCRVELDCLYHDVSIPRDLAKRAELARFAGLNEGERLAIDKWCEGEQVAYEAQLRSAMEHHTDEPMP